MRIILISKTIERRKDEESTDDGRQRTGGVLEEVFHGIRKMASIVGCFMDERCASLLQRCMITIDSLTTLEGLFQQNIH